MQKKPPADQPLEPIALGSLIPGSAPIDVAGRTWRFGLAMTEHGQQAVFAHACDWRELFVQCVVASVGRALGLPVPPCYLLLATPESFPERPHEPRFFAFACRAGEHPTMAAFARRMGEAVDILTAAKRETANRLMILDEWASNGQRDHTAILVDTARGLQLIDHHPSLTDISDPAARMRNWVFEVAHQNLCELDSRRLKEEMESSASKVFSIDLGILADQAGALGNRTQVDAWLKMLDFLATRRHHLEELFCLRLGLPEKHLNLAP